MLPLIIAGGAGLARGIGGIISAGQRARRDRDLIKRAYKVAQAKQEREQSFTREDTNEDLNARGILNGGSSSMPTSGPIADAYRGKALKTGVDGFFENKAIQTENFNQRRMALSSTKGQTGASNTLSGSVNKDLSGQFYNEQEDLWQGREAAINGTKAQQAQDTSNAISNGIQTGMDVYNAAGAIGAARAPAAAAAASGTPGGVTIRGAFGIDPVNPLGIGTTYQLGQGSNFNFNVAGQQDPEK